MKSIFNQIYIIIILASSFSACSLIKSKRNYIQFDIPISTVQDSIIVMNGLMGLLKPAVKQPRIISWYLKNNKPNEIDINGVILNFASLKPKDLNVFTELSNSDKIRFVNLVKFFVIQNLTSCRKDFFTHSMSTAYLYGYRDYDPSGESDYVRDILLDDSQNNLQGSEFEKDYMILDKKDKLVLIKML